MGDMCDIGNFYYLTNGKSVTLSIKSIEDIEVACRCCFKWIKTKTAFHIDTHHPIGNTEPNNRWYCHKCCKALSKIHNGDV